MHIILHFNTLYCIITHYILKLIISGCWFYQKDLRHLWLGWQRCIGHVLLHGYLLCSWSQHHQEGLCQVWTNGQLWKEICQVWRSSLPCSTSRQGTRELWQLPWLHWTFLLVNDNQIFTDFVGSKFIYKWF